MGMGDLRRICGAWITVSVRMDGALVLEQKAVQGVRREASIGSDHFQCCLRLLLQSPPACSLRDHPCSI